MLDYDFMRTAFAAGGIVAVLSGLVGYFLVLRGQTFAGHALSHVGFTGATGAILFGLSPLTGLVGFTVLAGMAMGFLGERIAARDVAIGMMLSLALGLGLLFLHFYTAYATQATALLFGNVLGVGPDALLSLTLMSVVPCCSAAFSRNWRKPRACPCGPCRSPFSRSSASRWPNAPRSSAYSSCSP